jgi:hypothetical protein
MTSAPGVIGASLTHSEEEKKYALEPHIPRIKERFGTTCLIYKI